MNAIEQVLNKIVNLKYEIYDFSDDNEKFKLYNWTDNYEFGDGYICAIVPTEGCDAYYEPIYFKHNLFELLFELQIEFCKKYDEEFEREYNFTTKEQVLEQFKKLGYKINQNVKGDDITFYNYKKHIDINKNGIACYSYDYDDNVGLYGEEYYYPKRIEMHEMELLYILSKVMFGNVKN